MEAAGLALAILPLLVNQLDNYVQGLQTVKGFRAKRYRQQLDGYFSNIGTQHVLFLNTLERALEGVVDYQDGIDELINDPLGEAWKKPDLVRKMETKLGRNYRPFKTTMEELSSLLEDLNRRLRFEKMPSARKVWDDASILEREVKKFRDIFSKSIYADLLSRIVAANTILDQLVKQSEYRNEPRRRRISQRPLFQYRKARISARSLHKLILRGRCWKCACKPNHRVHFILQHPDTQTIEATINLTPGNPSFDIVLTSVPGVDHLGSLVDAYKLKAESEIIQPSTEVRSMDVFGNPGAGSPSYSLNSHTSTAVQFSLSMGRCDSSPCGQAQLTPINDLCAALSAAIPTQGGNKTLGWLSDDSHKHNITYLEKGFTDRRSQSLADLIATSSLFLAGQTDDGFLFSQLDRLRVAVNLSCSVLQFHGSWLKPHWRAQDIMFNHQDASGVGSLYVPWNVADNIGDSSLLECETAPTLIRNQILFPLGLALVELSLCQNLESMRERDEEDQNEAHANLKTATRLLPKVEETSGPEYAEVVDRCLFWHDRKGTSLENEQMQEEVFQLIILPLIENLRSFTKWL